MPSITQLEYLLAVDRTRHFGRAAEECHVSQPSLSMQIQKLEEELDLIVFDRSKKPILPTQKGQEVIEQARSVVREHKRLYEVSKNKNSELSGEFKLAIIPTLSPYLIPLFLNEFAKKYPKVELHISEEKTEDIIQALYDDRIDAGLAVTPLKNDRIIEKVLFYEPFYGFVSKTHPLYKKKKIVESELKGEQIWLLDEGHCFRNQVMKVCSLKNKTSLLKNVYFESGSLETLMNLIRKSYGYTLLPYLATQGVPDNEKEMIKPFSEEGTTKIPTREVSLVYSRNFLKEPIICALEELIIELLPKELRSLKQGAGIEVINI